MYSRLIAVYLQSLHFTPFQCFSPFLLHKVHSIALCYKHFLLMQGSQKLFLPFIFMGFMLLGCSCILHHHTLGPQQNLKEGLFSEMSDLSRPTGFLSVIEEFALPDPVQSGEQLGLVHALLNLGPLRFRCCSTLTSELRDYHSHHHLLHWWCPHQAWWWQVLD